MSEASMIHRHDMIIVFIVASRRTSIPVSSVHRNTVPMTVPEGRLIRLADTRFFSFRKPSRSLVSEYFPSDMTFPIILDGTTYFPSSLTSTCVSRKMFPPPLDAYISPLVSVMNTSMSVTLSETRSRAGLISFPDSRRYSEKLILFTLFTEEYSVARNLSSDVAELSRKRI